MSDYISRADAIEAKPEYRNEDMWDKEKSTYNKGWNDCNDAWVAIIKALPSADATYATCATCAENASCIMAEPDGKWKACKDYRPSAEAEPTVIRSKTLLPTKDFKEWAKRIKEVNPNAVVIPCDAEAVSAEAVQGWIPCSERLPSESGTYLVTTAKGAVWADHFYANSVDDRHWSYRTRRVPIAWMPMPKPYKGGDDE